MRRSRLEKRRKQAHSPAVDRRATTEARAERVRQGLIRKIFRTLETAMGAQHWWPAGSAFEVVVGAYLTQNTAWTNVERAIANLREAGLLSVAGIRGAAVEELEQLVRPAGYFRQKAARLKRFVDYLDARYGGSLEAMFATASGELREELLALNGIGPETADSILLYAANREVFVVDAYTRRIWQRHGLASESTDYEEIRAGAECALAELNAAEPKKLEAGSQRTGSRQEADEPMIQISIHAPSAASQMARSELARRYNEFHALLVQTGKHFCLKAAPRCENCPLRPLLPPGRRPR